MKSFRFNEKTHTKNFKVTYNFDPSHNYVKNKKLIRKCKRNDLGAPKTDDSEVITRIHF